jgi:hypothetical protein
LRLPGQLDLDEVRALIALISRIDRDLTQPASTLGDDLYGIGGGEATGALPAQGRYPAAPKIIDEKTAHEYLMNLRKRRREALGLRELFEPPT